MPAITSAGMRLTTVHPGRILGPGWLVRGAVAYLSSPTDLVEATASYRVWIDYVKISSIYKSLLFNYIWTSRMLLGCVQRQSKFLLNDTQNPRSELRVSFAVPPVGNVVKPKAFPGSGVHRSVAITFFVLSLSLRPPCGSWRDSIPE